MNIKSFITNLFMKIMGCIFILIAIGIVVYNIYIFFENKYILKNGNQTKATIIYKSYYSDTSSYDRDQNGVGSIINTTTYKIKYIVDGKEYTNYCESPTHSYNVNDEIYIYYLPNNPEKIATPLEKLSGFFQVIIVCSIMLALGIPCVKY